MLKFWIAEYKNEISQEVCGNVITKIARAGWI